MHKRIEVQMYIDSILKGNLEPITKDTVKENLSGALVTEMQKYLNNNPDAVDRKRLDTGYEKLIKTLVSKSQQGDMGSFTYNWKFSSQDVGSTWATLGTSTITITHWKPYESATVTVYDKYDWSQQFLLSPQGLRESYVDLIRMIFNGNNINLNDDAYGKLLSIAEHHAIRVLPDEATSRMLAREYSKAGKKVTPEELHKYRLVNIEYPASAVYTESQWNKLQQDIQAQQDGIVVVGKRGADDKSDDSRDDKATAGSGDNPVRTKIKDLQDPAT
jgi:hypothetical protein